MHKLGKIALMGAVACLSSPAMASDTACHRLMTEEECTAFSTALSSLPPGQARDFFLEAHHALMHEREAACRDNRTGGDVVIYHRHVSQVPRGS